LPAAFNSAPVHLLALGIVVVVVLVLLVDVVVVVVQPRTPIMPALFVGVGGQTRAKSVRLSLVELILVRLFEPSPAVRVVGVPEEEFTPSGSGSEVFVGPV